MWSEGILGPISASCIVRMNQRRVSGNDHRALRLSKLIVKLAIHGNDEIWKKIGEIGRAS